MLNSENPSRCGSMMALHVVTALDIFLPLNSNGISGLFAAPKSVLGLFVNTSLPPNQPEALASQITSPFRSIY